MKLTVYFDGTFWFALVEHINRKGQYKAFRYPFGKKPKDSDVWDFILKHLPNLIEKYDQIETDSSIEDIPHPKKMNPKRMQRSLNKSKKQAPVSTKAQLEMQKLHDGIKQERKSLKKKEHLTFRAHTYHLKQEKRHQKKKGH
ncbi:YjdF family protein [Streptococcus ferus]|uniref:YjdF family protein n=1 Tax=Streptococcus ferus TaxID=1345 RepID=UPI0023579DF3|nr:YjdF family protein [Streptococcus ferus]